MPSLPVRQLCTVHDRHATARLIVFVPRLQLGTALQQAVARERGSTAGLTATTIEQYAQSLAKWSLKADGRSELDAGSRYFLTATALQTLDAHHRDALTGNQPLSGTIAPLARTFATLRTHRISPDAYRRRTSDVPRQTAQAEAYARYEALLHEHDQYDAALLFDTAVTLIAEGGLDLSGNVWAIMDTVPLSAVEQRFVARLRHQASIEPGLYRIGPAVQSSSSSTEPGPPPPSAAALFRDAPLPDPATAAPSPVGRIALAPSATLSSDEAESVRFWTATGPRREVQAVFDDILGRDRSLDRIEIAYTSPDPYLPLLDSLAERYDIPVSLSSGRSIDATRPGQALRGFFDWVANGCPIPDLIGLLRAGLVRLDAAIEDEDPPEVLLDSRRAATLLAQTRYPDNCRDYADTFDAWIDTLTEEIEGLEAAEASWTSNSLRDLREKREAVATLADVVQHLLTLSQMTDRSRVRPTALASGAETFLEQYGPTPKPTTDADEHTPDQAARNRLIERLQAVSSYNEAAPLSPRQLATRMRTWMGLSPFVRAQQPQPGHAHVVPLESVGYAGRDHLYIVGLDASSTTATVSDDPLLADEERTALSDETRPLPLRSRKPDAEAWRTRRALARHEGSATLAASTYDLTEGEDLFEAPLYLRLKEETQSARNIKSDADDPQVRHYPLAPTHETLLSDLDRWTSRSQPAPNTLSEAFSTRFPGVQHGLDAAAARDANTYTTHDGLLSARSYDGLDPLSQNRPVSAGRLETYAQAPYAYFLRYVLGVDPLDEPALDDVAWLDALGRGAVLHQTFRRFMSELDRRPTLGDEAQLREVFETVLADRRAELPPPSEVVFASTRRQLWNDALLFLRLEAARSDEHSPQAFELGFGLPPHRREETDYAEAPTLQLGPVSFALRGRIDRIDQLPDGTFSVWDYKTGSSRNYDETDLLGDFHLQWALYAYALEELTDVRVETAGYFFTSTDEMGKRIAAAPSEHREAVSTILQQIEQSITAGAFPLTDADALRYNYDRLFHDYGERRKQLTAKAWPDDRPAPPILRDD